MSDGPGAWQTGLHKLVLSYLVHHGYSHTAHVFATSTGQSLEEDAASIRNRQSESMAVRTDLEPPSADRVSFIHIQCIYKQGSRDW